jgi:hypothetical protein
VFGLRDRVRVSARTGATARVRVRDRVSLLLG